ncbi:MAG: oligopeptide ABC transporter substrate-binding protein OppA, partial [Pseudomonadota bacterium]
TTGNTYNRGGYSNPEIDRLMAEARLAEDKAPFYTEVERIAAEDMPLIPLWHDVKTFLLDPSIRGWPFENAEDVWYIDRLYRAAEPSQ